MTEEQKKHKLNSRLELYTEMGDFLSSTRIRLLDAIAEHGSLSAAAKALPMSYKAAWQALDAMNNLADEPLVVRSVGGKQGGGTQLTPYAFKLISMYKAMELEYQRTVEILQASLKADATEINDFRKLMQRIDFQSSARNQLLGKVSTVTTGATHVVVRLNITEHFQILATITKKSAENLDIKFGQSLMALIKSSQIVLHVPDTENPAKLSADNQLLGTISHIEEGVVSADVTVDLPPHKSLGVGITRQSIEQLQLKVGSPIQLSFNASSVILCHAN